MFHVSFSFLFVLFFLSFLWMGIYKAKGPGMAFVIRVALLEYTQGRNLGKY